MNAPGKKAKYPSWEPEIRKTAAHAYYLKNKEKILAQTKLYAAANIDKFRAYRKAWKKRNPHVEYAYITRREARDPSFLLRRRIGRRIYVAMRKRAFSPPSQILFGCTYPELINHMEKLFRDGMSWLNYGDWEVDHKRPISAFDLTDPKQMAEACHYTNLQPLWRTENRVKAAKNV